MRPSLRFLFSHPAHWIALGAGSGLPAWAPGTWGTAFGWLVFAVVDALRGPAVPGDAVAIAGAWLAVCAVTFVIGAWAAGRTGADLGVADSGHIVIDEIVAIWLVLAALPLLPLLPLPAAAHAAAGLHAQALAFLVFRFFDIVKPPPIGFVDARFKNGWGVMLDDLMAAGYSVAALALGALLVGALQQTR